MDKENKKNDYGYNSTFPTILRKLMEEKSVTQEVLAKHCGTQRQTIGQWKDGNTKPDITALKKIAEFFNVSSDYLVGITDNSSIDLELRAVCDYTGLSEKAVVLLRERKEMLYLNSILSELLINDNTWRALKNILEAIHCAEHLHDITIGELELSALSHQAQRGVLLLVAPQALELYRNNASFYMTKAIEKTLNAVTADSVANLEITQEIMEEMRAGFNFYEWLISDEGKFVERNRPLEKFVQRIHKSDLEKIKTAREKAHDEFAPHTIPITKSFIDIEGLKNNAEIEEIYDKLRDWIFFGLKDIEKESDRE